MKRSTFFTIAAIIGILFGGMMFLTPAKSTEGFGIAATPENAVLFRALGAMILASGILNLLVRKHAASEPLNAVLIGNIAMHGLSMIADISAEVAGVLQFSKSAPGLIVHLFIGVGSLLYLMKMEKSA